MPHPLGTGRARELFVSGITVRTHRNAEAAESCDRLARLAARLLHAPVALMTIVEDDRPIVQGSCGLPEPFATMAEVPPQHSYCRLREAGSHFDPAAADALLKLDSERLLML